MEVGMRNSVYALVVAIAVAATAIPALAGKQDFVLVNKTGLTIAEVYVSSSKTNDWQEDVLGQGVLEDDTYVTIRFTGADRQCKFDIKIVDEDGDELFWTNIDLCKAERVTLKPKGVAVIE
jgi:hypothetical protein